MEPIKMTIELNQEGRYKDKCIIDTGDGRPVIVPKNAIQEAVENIASDELKRLKSSSQENSVQLKITWNDYPVSEAEAESGKEDETYETVDEFDSVKKAKIKLQSCDMQQYAGHEILEWEITQSGKVVCRSQY